MKQSKFIKYIEKFFTGVVLAIVARLNGTTNPLTYDHRRHLTKTFSYDGNWQSFTQHNSAVAADVISMDSELPVKRRDALSRASGEVPKQGMELSMNEKQLTTLQRLAATPGLEAQMHTQLFQDTPKVITGVFERNEAIFLEALSTGVCVVEDAENEGTAVRLDFGFLPENKFGATDAVWSNAGSSKPVDDLLRMQAQAATTGNRIIRFKMDRTAFNNFAKSTQVKEMVAFYLGFVGTAIPVPNLARVNEALQANHTFSIEIVDRKVTIEKKDVRTVTTPWADGAVVGIVSENLGNLVWSTLAEANQRAEGVSYEIADDFILVSRFLMTYPTLKEVTRSQALVVPILTNTDAIYLLDTKSVQA